MGYITERVNYLKGLADGMKLDTETNEGKLLSAIISVLEDIGDSIDDMEKSIEYANEDIEDLTEQIDNISDDLYEDEDDDDDDDECDCDDEECDCDDDEPIGCPNCGADLTKMNLDVDEEKGIVKCEACGYDIPIDMSDDDCGCGCCDCHDCHHNDDDSDE